jgi:hypothetical protein
MKWLVPTALVTLALVAAPATVAKDREVLVRGTCTGPSTSKLKLSDEDAGIEVEFEVDQNRNGVRWSVVLRRPNAVLVRTTRVTRGPSGSFELERVVANRAGSDRISARATRASGEVCRATAVF